VRHLSDDVLILHYYREDGPQVVAVEQHLRTCAQCAASYDALTGTLDAVTPPDLVEAPDDITTLRQLLREHVRDGLPRARSLVGLQAAPALLALVWAVPAIYPFSSQALFASAQLAHEYPAAIALVALTLLWACAGPFVAVFALHRLPDGVDRVSTRALTIGSLAAAISPALFLLASRADPGLSRWYGALAAAALVSWLPWPRLTRSTMRLLYVHRLSALLLTVFVLAHVLNQAIAFVSLSSYTAMRNVMRVASQQPISYAVIVGAVAIQMATGAAIGMRNVRAGALASNLQAVSGWYLAAFLLSHVFSVFLFGLPAVATPTAAPASGSINLLVNARAAAQLPYYVLSVAAFLFHVGVYARLAALAYLAEASVRRLSYAAALAGTTVVVTVGLALCGIHLLR
jgi:succinate dehydrogenase/fumarate reductase cytochrome b subunit